MNRDIFYLKTGFRKINVSMRQIAEDMKVSQSYVSAILTGKKKIGGKIAIALSDLYGFNIDWLLTGEGPMLKEKDRKEFFEESELNEKEVPFSELPLSKQLDHIYSMLVKLDKNYLKLSKDFEELKERKEDKEIKKLEKELDNLLKLEPNELIEISRKHRDANS